MTQKEKPGERPNGNKVKEGIAPPIAGIAEQADSLPVLMSWDNESGDIQHLSL